MSFKCHCVCSQTEKGSALHEAALYGKTEVVQKLLSAGKNKGKLRNYQSFDCRKCPQDALSECSPGIDVNIVDCKNLTALDTVRDMPSQKSRQIASLIQGTSGADLARITGPAPALVLGFTLVLCLCSSHERASVRHEPASSTSASASREPEPQEKRSEQNFSWHVL